MYAGSLHKVATLVSGWSVVVAALTLAAIAVRFAFFVEWDAPMTFIPISEAGIYLPFVLVLNFFLFIGTTGNAILWGSLGVWVAKKALDGDWYRYALKEQAKEATFIAEERHKRTKI